MHPLGDDASVEWPEDESPCLTVGRIVAPPQPVWGEARARSIDDGLAFSPWHGPAAHRPLGSISRARPGGTRCGRPVGGQGAARGSPVGPRHSDGSNEYSSVVSAIGASGSNQLESWMWEAVT